MRGTAALFHRARKHRLTTKQVGHEYYKGNRTGRLGDLDKHGVYRVDYNVVRTYVVPEGLKDFKLTPFVTRKLVHKPGAHESWTYRPTGEKYLAMWKRDNGDD